MDNPTFDSSGELATRNERKSEINSRQNGFEIKRKVGLFTGSAFIIGRIIGTGIFITPGTILLRSGSVGLALVIWAASGVVSIFGALAYTELGTLIPKSGGEYVYLMDGLGSMHPFWGPLPAFLYSWLMILLLRPVGVAIGCLITAQYTIRPLWIALDLCTEDESQTSLVIKLTAILYLGLLTAINCRSVNWALRISAAFTMAKLGALAILICCGIYSLCLGNIQHLARGFQGSNSDPGNIALAFYAGMWSYGGWSTLNNMVEELKEPATNLPRALLIGLGTVMVFYLSVNVAYLAVLSPEELIDSKAVAVDVANRLLGPVAFIIPLGVAFSSFGSQLTSFFSGGRMYFASAREGHLMDFLSYIHVDSRTPVPALIMTALMSVLMIMARSVADLINFSSLTYWMFYTLIMITILILRKTRPDVPRPFRVPLAIPIFLILVGCYMIIVPIITHPNVESCYILGALLVGIIVYVVFIYHKFTFPMIAPLTRIIQLTLNVGPAAKSASD